jgi:trans-aconitate methyltransferase
MAPRGRLDDAYPTQPNGTVPLRYSRLFFVAQR